MNLRPYQQEAVDALLATRKGIVQVPAGGGKTVIGASAAREFSLKHSTLSGIWLCHTNEQKQQAEQALARMGEEAMSVHTVASQPDTTDADLIIVDECHHVAAKSWRKLIEQAPDTCTFWGLSATPIREDDQAKDVFKLLGNIVYQIDKKTLTDSGFLVPGKVYLYPIPHDADTHSATQREGKRILKGMRRTPGLSSQERKARAEYQAAKDLGINNYQPRINAAARVVNELKGPVLVLVSTVDQGRAICEQINVTTLLVSARTTSKKKRAEAMQSFKTGEVRVLVCTSLADEGLDLPLIEHVVLLAGGKSANKIEQRAGRAMRTSDGKNVGTIHDFTDQHHPMLYRQALARRKTYAKLGYEIMKKELPSQSSAGPQGHAKHSPSKLHYLNLCPSFVSDNTRSAASESGTRCHEALETDNYQGLDDRELASVKRIAEFLEPYLDAADDDDVYNEIKLDVAGLTWGTCDLLINMGAELWAFDYKFGVHPVPAVEENFQAWAYTLGAFHRFPHAKTCTFRFILPNQDEVDEHTFERSDMPMMFDAIKEVIKRAEAGGEFGPTEKVCDYCARIDCPFRFEAALAITKTSEPALSKELSIPADLSPENIKDPEVMAKCLQLVPTLEKWTKAIKTFALALRMEEGEELPGYDLLTRNNRLSINDPLKAWDLAKEFGLSDEDIQSCCTISASSLAKAVGSKAERGDKQRSEESFRHQLIQSGASDEPSESFYLKRKKETN